ncbi:hypothetical protein NLI96_g13373 [Meripilus lineatus]|uniref:Hyaluronan/mRNA-binding protein domain-containing protein n=1 Tax=Meripilus lineatus TaxID=2056292 RepID=A0AAD5UN93_9APHY|nr:hypothetical protein NLI96_g13373 [Physisporinus lineatus]
MLITILRVNPKTKTPAETWGAAGEAANPEEGAAPAAAEGDKAGEGRRREREPEEEDNTLTLDQYFKQQKELDIVPKLETRKANEGDDSIFKGATLVTKKDEDEDAYFIGKVMLAILQVIDS